MPARSARRVWLEAHVPGRRSGDGHARSGHRPYRSLGTAAYWLQNTSLEVQPTTAPGPAGGSIEREGPRASTEAYQIVLRPTGGGLRNVKPAWYWKTDYTLLSEVRRNVAQALMAAGVH
jgi:hypothetical protein